MKANIADLLQRLPGKTTTQWPAGERFIQAFANGSMSVELYAPLEIDPQTPHEQDELYFVQSGSGTLMLGSAAHQFRSGDRFFVPAGVEHHFKNFTADFVTWVVFWGPKGGEAGC